jgi:Domain of unknown function (DUF4440)
MKLESDPLQTDRQFFMSLLDSNIERLDSLLDDDFILIDVMRGDEITKSSLLEVLRSGQLRFTTIEPVESHVRLYDGAAIVTGRTQMKARFGEIALSVHSRYTHVFIDRGGQWRLVSAQGTQIPGTA